MALLTIFPESTLGKNGRDVAVRIPAYTDKLPDGPDNAKGILPGGSRLKRRSWCWAMP